MEYTDLKRLHTQLLLSGTRNLTEVSTADPALIQVIQLLISGQYYKICTIEPLKSAVFQYQPLVEFSKGFINGDLDLYQYVNAISEAISHSLSSLPVDEINIYGLAVAVLFLQMFVQTNFTGPQLPFDKESGIKELGFLNIVIQHSIGNQDFAATLQKESITLLSTSGQQPYQFVQSPIFLILSLRLFELLSGSSVSLLSSAEASKHEDISDEVNVAPINKDTDISAASIYWWRSRALQVQQSLLPEESAILLSLSFALLTSSTVGAFINPENVNSETNQALLVVFHLESAKNGLVADSETQVIESLAKAKKVSGLNFILTGCKAKRTKYQRAAVAALAILAKSQDSMLSYSNGELTGSPQDVKLESDLLLEKPEFDNIGDADAFAEASENDEVKRIKIDYSNYDDNDEDQEKKLLPVALSEDLIPDILRTLNPNEQPALSNLDNVQLLLRLEAIRVNNPADNLLINEELLALVIRVLFSPNGTVNWLVYSRALWLRSLLETKSARTVERGVLQLYSLVEELGIDSDKTSRLFPKTEDEINFPSEITDFSISDDKVLINAVRSKFIYQLPLMARWSMDETLAEKLVELGSLKSALEIYERLQDWTGAALCYGSTGDHEKAEELIMRRLSENPSDARALSILGDVKQDPSLWEKSWEVGRYANAKRSLSKYYYNPPKDSGMTRNYELTISHMYDCLKANPLSFENWYFYGCVGLEVENYELAGEAFTRCVTMDETSSYSWSNLASALLKMDKTPEAFHALKKAVNAGEETKKSWKIWENYLIVAVKLGQWDDVLNASRTLLNVKKEIQGEGSLDIPILEKLANLLIKDPFQENVRQTHFEKTCIDFICNMVPTVVTSSAICWRIIAKVDLWRKKPWLALEDYEKAYRAVVNSHELSTSEEVWNDAVETCVDLVSAYENFGELPGKHGAGDVICKDWKFKSKSSVRSLMSKGKASWEYTDGWEKLVQLKEEVMNS